MKMLFEFLKKWVKEGERNVENRDFEEFPQ
jgi:hypothetical protein